MPSLLAVALAFSTWLYSEDAALVRPGTRPPDPGAGVVAQGVLDRETVRYYVQLQRPAVRNCYQLELGKRPGLTTSITVNLNVTAEGKVSSVENGPDSLASCVGQALGKIRFPALRDLMSDGTTRASQSSTVITYRFAFRPAPRQGLAPMAPAAPVAPPAPETEGPRAPRPSTAASAASQPGPTGRPAAAPDPAPGPSPKRRARPGRRVDTRHGDDPLRGIPAGDAL